MAVNPRTAEHPEAGSTPQEPASGVSALPHQYTPRIAGHARGPFITPDTEGVAPIAPSDWRWRNARTYVVRDAQGTEWRCLRVCSTTGASAPRLVGYWAVERLGTPLPISEDA